MKAIRLQRMTGLFTASCLSSVYLPRRFSCLSACMALGASQQGLTCRRSSGSRSSGLGRELVKGAWACINLAQASSREGHCELRGSPTRQRGGSSAALCSSEMECSKMVAEGHAQGTMCTFVTCRKRGHDFGPASFAPPHQRTSSAASRIIAKPRVMHEGGQRWDESVHNMRRIEADITLP